MKSIRYAITFFLFLIFMSPVFSQFQEVPIEELPDLAGMQVRLNTESNATFQGVLYSITDEFVLIRDKDGQVLTIVRAMIEKVFMMDPEIENMNDKVYFQDSAANRLIVMPTGFAMEPGEFHIADQEVAAVTMSYGVSENFSVWGGISIPGALVSARYIWNLGEKAALSLGSFAGISWFEFMGLLIPYSILSIGNPEDNFTIGTGGAFTFDSNDFSLNMAILTLGRKWVLSDTTAIVTENWIIWGRISDSIEDVSGELPEEITTRSWDYIPLAAAPAVVFRIAGSRFSWDIGAVLPIFMRKEAGKYTVMGIGGAYTFIPLPLISLTYRID